MPEAFDDDAYQFVYELKKKVNQALAQSPHGDVRRPANVAELATEISKRHPTKTKPPAKMAMPPNTLRDALKSDKSHLRVWVQKAIADILGFEVNWIEWRDPSEDRLKKSPNSNDAADRFRDKLISSADIRAKAPGLAQTPPTNDPPLLALVARPPVPHPGYATPKFASFRIEVVDKQGNVTAGGRFPLFFRASCDPGAFLARPVEGKEAQPNQADESGAEPVRIEVGLGQFELEFKHGARAKRDGAPKGSRHSSLPPMADWARRSGRDNAALSSSNPRAPTIVTCGSRRSRRPSGTQSSTMRTRSCGASTCAKATRFW